MAEFGIFNEKTKFLELNNKVDFSLEVAKTINIDEDTFRTYSHWYLYNGEFYYYKKSYNEYEMLNHLICAKIAEFFKLLTVQFQLAKAEDSVGLASKNFRVANCDYVSAGFFSYNMDAIFALQEYERRFSIGNNLSDKMISDILKLIAFHIYTSLDDLIIENIIFKETKDSFALDYSFDYDYAFNCEKDPKEIQYGSPICGFAIPSVEFDKILLKYPFFADYLKSFLDINMDNILKKVVEEHSLSLNELYLDHYKEQDEIKKEFIRGLDL